MVNKYNVFLHKLSAQLIYNPYWLPHLLLETIAC